MKKPNPVKELSRHWIVQWRAEKGNDNPLNHWLNSPFSSYDPFYEEDRMIEYGSEDEAVEAIKAHPFFDHEQGFGEFRIIEVVYTEIRRVAKE